MSNSQIVEIVHWISAAGIVCVLIALAVLFYASDHGAEVKRYWHPYVITCLTLTLLAMAMAAGCPPSALTFIVPGAVLISLSNVRNVRFCDCGTPMYQRNWQVKHDPYQCARCKGRCS